MLFRQLSIIAAAAGFFAVLTSLFQFQNGIATLKPELVKWVAFNWAFLLGNFLGVVAALVVAFALESNEFDKTAGKYAAFIIFIVAAALSSWLTYDGIWPPDSLAILFFIIALAARELGVAVIQGEVWFA